jgi:membrane-bound serine protease (ClpP class)
MSESIGLLIMIICYVVGSGLLILEAFIPGFGVAGTLGIILEIAGIVLTNTYHGLAWSLGATFLVLLFVGTVIFLTYRSAQKGRLSKSPIILTSEEKADAGSSAEQLKDYVNKEGITVSSLRPGGFVETEGIRLNASSEGEFIEKGKSVRITGVEGNHVTVRAI